MHHLLFATAVPSQQGLLNAPVHKNMHILPPTPPPPPHPHTTHTHTCQAASGMCMLRVSNANWLVSGCRCCWRSSLWMTSQALRSPSWLSCQSPGASSLSGASSCPWSSCWSMPSLASSCGTASFSRWVWGSAHYLFIQIPFGVITPKLRQG